MFASFIILRKEMAENFPRRFNPEPQLLYLGGTPNFH